MLRKVLKTGIIILTGILLTFTIFKARYRGIGVNVISPQELKENFEFLRNKEVAFVGDSTARFMYAAFLREFPGACVQSTDHEIIYGHKNFNNTLAYNIKSSFYWAPFTDNVTSVVEDWLTRNSPPYSVVISTGLWHMLHVTLPLVYQEELNKLSKILHLLESKGSNIFLLNIVQIQYVKLKTKEKQEHMTATNLWLYSQAIAKSNILKPLGPCTLINIQKLSGACGADCTADGIHYNNQTYSASLYQWRDYLSTRH